MRNLTLRFLQLVNGLALGVPAFAVLLVSMILGAICFIAFALLNLPFRVINKTLEDQII